MFRKNRHHNNNNNNRNYNQHDNRSNLEPLRKVHFKNTLFGKYKRKDGSHLHRALYLINEDDVDMAGGSGGGGQQRISNLSRGRGFRRDQSSRQDKQLKYQHSLNPNCTWHQVTIPYGQKHSKEYLIPLLSKHLDCELEPVAYTMSPTASSFYCDDFKIAQKIREANYRLTLNDGYKLRLLVKSLRSPACNITDEMKKAMADVMANRYIAENKALNLAAFHKDPALSSFFCPLSIPKVLITAMDMVKEHIPDLAALDLSKNHITSLEPVAERLCKLTNLSILYLKHNLFNRINQLNGLQKLNILELNLEDNDIKKNYPGDTVQYTSEIRKKFPKLMKLDSIELAPIISFDVTEECKLPEPQASFVCNEEGRDIVKAFLQQYFVLYDSDNRLELLQAYDEKAVFSLTMAYPHNQNAGNSSQKLSNYTQDNRNLLLVKDHARRQRLIHHGKINIVKNLNMLPKTLHDLSSFTVDLTLFTPHLLSLTVCGIFKELEGANPMRYFTRSFVIVPVGQGFCITNEMYFVTNALESQTKNAFKTTPPPLPTPAAVAPVPVVAAPTAVLNDDIKMQMLQTLSNESGMNLEWSKKCLDEIQWDYQRALWTFNSLHQDHKIPPEAFIK